MDPTLEFVFQVKVNFAARVQIGSLPSGVRRGYTPTSGGEVVGPRLQGRVVPGSGADFAGWWPNGVVEFNAQYLLEATDGTLIVIKNRASATRRPTCCGAWKRWSRSHRLNITCVWRQASRRRSGLMTG